MKIAIRASRQNDAQKSAYLVSGVHRDVVVLEPLSPQARKHLLVLLIFDDFVARDGRGREQSLKAYIDCRCDEEIDNSSIRTL